jgi:hypothetical protein
MLKQNKKLCNKCNKNTTLHTYCKKCFLHIVEKRIRKNIRINIGFKKNDRVLIMEPICKHFISKFSNLINIQYIPKSKFGIKKWNDKIYINKLLIEYINNNKIKYTFIPLTINNEVSLYIESLFKGLKPKSINNKNKIYQLFNTITSEELLRFCNYKKIKYIPEKSKINDFINDIEKRYPGTIFSMKHAIE